MFSFLFLFLFLFLLLFLFLPLQLLGSVGTLAAKGRVHHQALEVLVIYSRLDEEIKLEHGNKLFLAAAELLCRDSPHSCVVLIGVLAVFEELG